MKKTLSLAVAACIASFAAAQQPSDLNEVLIWNAYNKLRADQQFRLDITGYETIGTKTHRFSSTLFWSLGTDPRTGQMTRAYVELDDYSLDANTPILEHRYVGDGQTLWSYNQLEHRYSADFYSYYGKQTPEGYLGTDAPRLLAQLYSVTQGHAAWLVRLMREINPGSDLLLARYQSWAPGYTPGQPPTIPAVRDPLDPTRSYSSGGTLEYVLYGPYTTNPSRSVAFEIIDQGTASLPDWRLTNIFFAEKGPNRFTDWTLQVSDPVVPPRGSFIPYSAPLMRGWQPMASPRAFSG